MKNSKIITDPPKRNSPLMIEIMLRAYYDPNFRPDISLAAQHAMARLLSNGLLQRHSTDEHKITCIGSDGDTYKATSRGRAWVEMICSTPLPHRQQLWIDPRDNRPVLDLL